MSPEAVRHMQASAALGAMRRSETAPSNLEKSLAGKIRANESSQTVARPGDAEDKQKLAKLKAAREETQKAADVQAQREKLMQYMRKKA